MTTTEQSSPDSFTSLGNSREFYRDRERYNLDSGSRGGINSTDGYEYFRAFGDASVVAPPEHWTARRLGTVAVSIDIVVHGDATVETIVQNRRTEDLPDGPKFPGVMDEES